jgi:hypothetical protein
VFIWGFDVVIVVVQELAADAGRNLDHALPSMDAAMHAIQSLTPAELAELRNMKNPSDLVQQVSQVYTGLIEMGADCISSQRWVELELSNFFINMITLGQTISDQNRKKVNSTKETSGWLAIKIPDVLRKVNYFYHINRTITLTVLTFLPWWPKSTASINGLK